MAPASSICWMDRFSKAMVPKVNSLTNRTKYFFLTAYFGLTCGKLNVKMATLRLWALLCVFMFLLLKCGEKELVNEIRIDIIEPAEGAVYTNAQQIRLLAEIKATDFTHNIDVILYRIGEEGNFIYKDNIHNFEPLVVVDTTINLSSYPAGAAFAFKIEACTAHLCNSKISKEVRFTTSK